MQFLWFLIFNIWPSVMTVDLKSWLLCVQLLCSLLVTYEKWFLNVWTFDRKLWPPRRFFGAIIHHKIHYVIKFKAVLERVIRRQSEKGNWHMALNCDLKYGHRDLVIACDILSQHACPFSSIIEQSIHLDNIYIFIFLELFCGLTLLLTIIVY